MGRRSERLLALLQALRRRRRPVPGQVLAEETGVSLRSLYRDIATLKSLGAAIDGEPGMGFQLRAEYFLPPLMFSSEELEAVALGLRGLIYGPDAELAGTARDVMAKIGATLPPDRRGELEAIGLFALPQSPAGKDRRPLAGLRAALREEQQVSIRYVSGDGVRSERVIHPVALGYDGNRQVLVAWCTLRGDFRSFRVDRIEHMKPLGQSLPEPRRTLLHRWQAANGLPELT
ncbi:MAG TPA: YafY family protein [Devosiaceae bacterium]|nr:YafY family protein [Devosiaceae bacterium]